MSRRNDNGARRGRAREDEVREYDTLIRYATAIVLFATGILLLLSVFGAAGPVGKTIFTSSYAIVGVGAFLLPFALIAVGVYAGFRRHILEPLTASGILLILASVLAFAGLFPGADFGGKAGTLFGEVISGFFGFWGALVLLIAVIAVGIAIVSDIEMLWALLSENVSSLWERFRSRKENEEDSEEFTDVVGVPEYGDEELEDTVAQESDPVVNVFNRTTGRQGSGIANFDAEYEAPPLSILGADRGRPGVGDIKANANIIKRTFQNFGIHLEMDEVSVGPTVTRYAVKPAEGVRLSKIVSLANNLELALAAHPVRIEAPIPGKSLVGIEVPNTVKAMVGLGGLLSAPEWSESTKPLLAALGRDITGTPHYVNIAKMPHALVAGATGSGKTCGKDTCVFSEKGMLTFEELCPLPLYSETDYALRVATRDGIETTSKNYNNGICNFYKITTDEGFSIEVTAEHPLWTLENGSLGWKSGGVMRVGDYVAISRGSKLFGEDVPIHFVPRPNKTNKARHIRTPKRMSPELGLLLGLLTADGGLTITNRIVYTQAREEVIGIYIALLKSLFDITPSIVVKSGSSNKAKDVIVYSKQLSDFLECLGMKPVRAQEKEIPITVRQSGPETIRAFIQGLMRNDGHISSTGFEITLANRKLLQQLQIMLLNFGIVSSVYRKKVKFYEMNEYWRLTLFGDDFALYAREIGFLTEEERLRADIVLVRPRNTNRHTIPTLSPLLKRLAHAYRSTFARLTQHGWQYRENILVPKYAFNSLRSYNAGDRDPSYPALRNILAFYEPLATSPDYQHAANIEASNFYYAKVASIERARGVGYDFEVPGSNSFVGNGFVNHNSVAIHALITSLLYRNGPNQLRFIMIDPKRVELTAYNGIPHLLTHVITDPKKTIFSLKWAAKEMERRYNILEAEHVRDIDSYHATIFEPAKARHVTDMPEALPFIIIVIDELADIMHSFPRELEASIVRLAQMSRATGIHLILSTQRPSVNVITGLIKANVPTRMALQVASQIDSRTILDGSGAETLLGAGDMLYLSSDMQKPVRIQTAFISENEVRKVVSYIKSHNVGDLSSIDFGGNGAGAEPNDVIGLINSGFDDDDIDDDLYADARATVETAGRASTSYLQRKLKIGYSRAARLMDVLEERGIIGPADGSKPREVFTRSAQAQNNVANANENEEEMF